MAEQASTDITIYCKGNIGATRLGDCIFTQKALFCLSLHGLKAERKYIDLANKPQSFLDLNKVKDDSFKVIYGKDKDGKDAEWKASCPVLEDRKNKVRIFDSGAICDYLEENYKPAVLAKDPEQEVPGKKHTYTHTPFISVFTLYLTI